MPDPLKYKSKKKYMQDCMHQTVHNEKRSPASGLAVCLNVWKNRHKKSTMNIINRFKKASVKEDLAVAENQDKPSIFLGGLCKDNTWRTQIKQEFKDSFCFIDPYDPDWDAGINIYDELTGIMKADQVVFFQGGDGSAKEKEFLDDVNKEYKEFEDIESIREYLQDMLPSDDVVESAAIVPPDKLEITWVTPKFNKEAGEYFENRYTKTYLAGLGITFSSKKDLYEFLTKGSLKELTKEQLNAAGSDNITLDMVDFDKEMSSPSYAESYNSMEKDLKETGHLKLEAPILIKANGKYHGFSGNRRANLAFNYNIPVSFWVVYAHQAKVASRIVNNFLNKNQ